jgi:hypothetical protein
MIAIAGDLVADPSRPDGVAGLAGRIAIGAAAGGSAVELIARVGDDPPGDALLLALSRAGVGHAAILRDPALPTPRFGMAGAAPAGASGHSAAAIPSVDVEDSLPNDEWDDALADEASHDQIRAVNGSGSDPVAGLRLRPEDLDLALRYLTDLTVVVLADPSAPGLVAVAAEGAAFAGAALVVVAPSGWAGGDTLPPDATVLVAPDHPADGSFSGLVAEYAVALDGGHSPSDAWAAATSRLGAERT